MKYADLENEQNKSLADILHKYEPLLDKKIEDEKKGNKIVPIFFSEEDSNKIIQAVENGADFHSLYKSKTQKDKGITPLLFCIIIGDLKLTDFFLRKKALIHGPEIFSSLKNKEVFELFINDDGEIWKTIVYDNTIFHSIALNGKNDFLELFYEKFKSNPEIYIKTINLKNKFGASPINISASQKKIEVFKTLIQMGADLKSIPPAHGNSVLHCVADSLSEELLDALPEEIFSDRDFFYHKNNRNLTCIDLVNDADKTKKSKVYGFFIAKEQELKKKADEVKAKAKEELRKKAEEKRDKEEEERPKKAAEAEAKALEENKKKLKDLLANLPDKKNKKDFEGKFPELLEAFDYVSKNSPEFIDSEICEKFKNIFKKLIEFGNLQFLSKLTGNETLINQFSKLDDRGFNTFIQELSTLNNAKNKSKNQSDFKTKITSFQTAVQSKREQNKPIIKQQEDQNSSSKLSKKALKALRKETKKDTEALRQETIKYAEDRKIVKIIINEKIEEIEKAEELSNEIIKKTKEENGQIEQIKQFLNNPKREINLLKDLPEFLQKPFSDLLEKGFKIRLKGSAVYLKNSNRIPGDLDIEILIPKLSEWKYCDINKLLNDNFGLKIGENDIFRQKPSEKNKIEKFSVNTKDEKRSLDFSLYDSDLMPSPHLSWTSNREYFVEILSNGKIEKTMPDNFFEVVCRKKSISEVGDNEKQEALRREDLIVNSNAHWLCLRLAFLLTIKLIEEGELESFFSSEHAKKLPLLDTLMKECGFRNNSERTNKIDKIDEFIEKHRLSPEESKLFLENLLKVSKINDSKRRGHFTAEMSNFIDYLIEAPKKIVGSPIPKNEIKPLNSKALKLEPSSIKSELTQLV